MKQVDWYEVGGHHQIPIITVPLSMLIKSVLQQIDEMSKSELEWLEMAAVNLGLVCQKRIKLLDIEGEEKDAAEG